MKHDVLVFAAHPDDEVLGCGGTLARHASEGDRVEIVFFTNGVGARGSSESVVQARRSAALAAARVMGVAEPTFMDFPDNQMDTVPLIQVIQSVEQILLQHRPSIVYTHHAGDLNIDHRIVQQAVLTALRPQPERMRPTILAFETASSTEWQGPSIATTFTPNWYSDISGSLQCKLQALGAYEAEIRAWPHARSTAAVEYLARWRGATVGVEAAEAFMLLRHIH